VKLHKKALRKTLKKQAESAVDKSQYLKISWTSEHFICCYIRGNVHIHVATNNVESTLFFHPPTHSRWRRSILAATWIFST
jgi:hypothetical protein